MRIRIGLMTFALGFAAVYAADRLAVGPSGPNVELPKAVSADIFPVLADTTYVLTREKNCGKDPAYAAARQECTNQRLFQFRDMNLYSRHEITCNSAGRRIIHSLCGDEERRKERSLASRHWREKTRAHIVVRYVGDHGVNEAHYFIEPYNKEHWRLTAVDIRYERFFVDDEEASVAIVGEHWSYKNARWRIATQDDGPYETAPGTRYLEFENENGDTVSF